MRFVWFWTFWHWSRESFRDGFLLRDPLHGIGGHWDEWFRHEASEGDRRAIEEAGRTVAAQRRFMAWLFRHWTRETEWGTDRTVPRFVLGQLAHLPPFNKWSAFDEYRAGYGVGGISAVVLAEKSSGEAEDIRTVIALALPASSDPSAPKIVAEGFQADAADLETSRQAALSLLSGKGLLAFLALWAISGRRPYPRWLSLGLGLGWLSVGGLILYLLLGPDPYERLFPISAALVSLWGLLFLVSVGMAGITGFNAWRTGRDWSTRLQWSQVWLRMNGGLTLMGGSAGAAFCLNTLFSLSRSQPGAVRRSWLWQRLFHRLRTGSGSWAATGVVTDEAALKPVVIESKLRACLQQGGIRHLITPRQSDAAQTAVKRVAGSLASVLRGAAPNAPAVREGRLGFAAEQQPLRIHPCRHLARALMGIGDFTSRWQMAVSLLAVVVSGVMVFALHDLRGILLPPPAPMVVKPSSPSPDYLWVSLDTQRPECFSVVLESKFWRNRRAEVTPHDGANPSMRAEIRLVPAISIAVKDRGDGVVWVERRPRFLGRDFASGERVGRYDLLYLKGLGHE